MTRLFKIHPPASKSVAWKTTEIYDAKRLTAFSEIKVNVSTENIKLM
jgi:hypothetical protein